MTFEQCYRNFNFMYEWKINYDYDEWYPCHIYQPKRDYNGITIFTRNASVITAHNGCVRKMSRDTYIKNREECIEDMEEYAYKHGFHKDVMEDLKLFDESNELEMIETAIC